MDKRILIPTDFSKNALNAARYALDLYAKLNCEFYFLNVFSLDGYTTKSLYFPEPDSAEYRIAQAKSHDSFLKLLDMLKLHNDNPKHAFHTISTYNYLSEAIKRTIAEKDIDLIVMGTQGASGTKGVIFGSNTVKAMEKIRECPVMAIPKNVKFSIPKEIVFPTNFKATFKRRKLSYLIEIAKMFESTVRVLYVSKKHDLTELQEINKQLLQDIMEPIKYNFHNLTENDVSEGITSFVESRNSDMIAFINHKHFFFNSVFSKPLVKEIGYKAIVPILALH
ncbi:universal stress protein [Maribacter flavus]|uniref:Universal stress protein n=1 Tax=Maribacter flavus TaxID=1658664 RepID=A0A5B2TZU1_9FLAO|nr:universal stress protein [Maribacter flavus]KAA2219787.1 universal stress protein [Maribacter flavus]